VALGVLNSLKPTRGRDNVLAFLFGSGNSPTMLHARSPRQFFDINSATIGSAGRNIDAASNLNCGKSSERMRRDHTALTKL
jgi:hypothetical protein